MEIDDEQFEQDVDGLIEWCEDLDYDKYMQNWTGLATSAKNDMVLEEEGLNADMSYLPKQTGQSYQTGTTGPQGQQSFYDPLR